MSHHTSRLLVRADDMGASWAANEGCMRAVTQGIARSVEVMMPCAWITDAAGRLDRHRQVDVGIHLTLTSEWDACKWRPLTQAGSLTDENGHFFPLLTPRPGEPRPSLAEQNWLLEEVRQEFHAQIELGLRLFPQASHVSSHMTKHFRDFDIRLDKIVTELCRTFQLKNDPLGSTVPMLSAYPKFPRDPDARIDAFIASLQALKTGTAIVVDHPASASEDERSLGHEGYRDVAEDRGSCLAVFTSPRLQQEIDRLGIELISYKSL